VPCSTRRWGCGAVSRIPASRRCCSCETRRHGSPNCGLLDAKASRALFTPIVGRQRLCAEPESTQNVLTARAGPLLAIRVAGTRLASRPRWSVARLGDLLASEQQRLAELTSGDLAVRASIEVSYRALREGEQMFRLYGLASFCTLSPAGWHARRRPRRRGDRRRRDLVDAHLLESPAPDRFSMRDLVRLYAAERAKADENGEELRIALHRLLTWYPHSLRAAAALGKPRRPFPLEGLPDGARPAGSAGVTRALAWLQGERANLLKPWNSPPRAAWTGSARSSRQLRGFCEWSGYWTDVVTVSVPGSSPRSRPVATARPQWLRS
jgi:hypothetical protein